jgi:hypothetical protein
VLCQHAAGILVNFDLPAAFHPGPLKSKVKSADPGKK